MHGIKATQETSRTDPRSRPTHAGGKSREFHMRLGLGRRMLLTGVSHAEIQLMSEDDVTLRGTISVK